MLFSDIDKAIAAYTSKRDTERRKKIDATIAAPKVRNTFEAWKKAKAEMKLQTEKLEALGYGISSCPVDAVYVHQSAKIEQLCKFDTETSKAKGALTEMKRTYTLKLFAGGEETQTLFASLADELASIVR